MSFIIVITQNVVLVSQAQLFETKVIKAIVNDHVIKLVSNLECVIEALSSTIIDRDRQHDFLGGLASSVGDSTKKIDQFVVRRSVFQFIIEITGSILEKRWDEMIANFHGGDVDWIYFHRIR